jgi:hypothetical protein
MSNIITSSITSLKYGTFTEVRCDETSLLICERDGYVNASRLIGEGGKKYSKLIKKKSWRKVVKYLLKKKNCRKLIKKCEKMNNKKCVYKLSSKTFSSLSGRYIHPELISYFANHISSSCAFDTQYVLKMIEKKKMIEEKEELLERVVPKDFQFHFTYLIYTFKRTSEFRFVKIVRRQTRNLTQEHRDIIKNKNYLVHYENLPISTTLNLKILKRVMKEIVGSKALKGSQFQIPKKYIKKFTKLVKRYVEEEMKVV